MIAQAIRKAIDNDAVLRHVLSTASDASLLRELRGEWEDVLRFRSAELCSGLCRFVGRVGGQDIDVALALLLEATKRPESGVAVSVAIAVGALAAWDDERTTALLLGIQHDKGARGYAADAVAEAVCDDPGRAPALLPLLVGWSCADASAPTAGGTDGHSEGTQALREATPVVPLAVARYARRLIESQSQAKLAESRRTALAITEPGRRASQRRGGGQQMEDTQEVTTPQRWAGYLDDGGVVWAASLDKPWEATSPAAVARDALLRAMVESPNECAPTVRDLLSSDLLAPALQALEVMAEHPQYFVDDIVAALASPEMLVYPIDYHARRALTAAFEHADAEQTASLMAIATSLEGAEHAADREAERLLTLECVPDPLRSAEVSRTIDELRARHGQTQDMPHFGWVESGVIRSPVNFEAMADLESTEFVNAFLTEVTRYGDDTHERTDLKAWTGGVEEAAHGLETFLCAHPKRLRQCAELLAGAPDVSACYVSRLLSALRQLDDFDPQEAFEVVELCAPAGDLDVRKGVSDVIATFADKWDAHQLRWCAERLVGWVDPKATPTEDWVVEGRDDSERDLLQIGINMARGRVAEALVPVALSQQDPEVAFDGLMLAANDPEAPVRAALIVALPRLFSDDDKYRHTWPIFAAAVEHPSPEIKRYADRYLPFMAVDDAHEQFGDLILELVDSDEGNLAAAGGGTAAVLYVRSGRGAKYVERALSADTHIACKRAAADAIGRAFEHQRLIQRALPHALKLAEVPDRQVRASLGGGLQHAPPESVRELEELLSVGAAGFGSAAIHGILAYLAKAAEVDPDVAVRILARFLDRSDAFDLDCMLWAREPAEICGIAWRHPEAEELTRDEAWRLLNLLVEKDAPGATEVAIRSETDDLQPEPSD